jgi:uncharacterized protein
MESLADTSPAAMTEELVTHANDYDFVSGASTLANTPMLVLSSDDGLAPMTDALVAAVRKAGGRRVTAVHVATDHGWSDGRIRLQIEILGWLTKLR